MQELHGRNVAMCRDRMGQLQRVRARCPYAWQLAASAQLEAARKDPMPSLGEHEYMHMYMEKHQTLSGQYCVQPLVICCRKDASTY